GKGWCGSGPPWWCLSNRYFGIVLSSLVRPRLSRPSLDERSGSASLDIESQKKKRGVVGGCGRGGRSPPGELVVRRCESPPRRARRVRGRVAGLSYRGTTD